MNSFKTLGLPIRSLAAEAPTLSLAPASVRAGRRLRPRGFALALVGLLGGGLAQAHGEADDLLPPEPGLRLDAAAALSVLRLGGQDLPSQRLRGYLLQGDVRDDRSGLRLEHGTLGLAWRATEHLGGAIVLGKHGGDAAHVEEAWVQGRYDAEDGRSHTTLGLGRQRPALGAVMTRAGHFDAHGLMPLAKQMTLNGDWIDDGAQLGWRREDDAGRWQLDLGLWRGRVFPGGEGAGPVPSVHAGWSQGAWALDAWAAHWRPKRRGAVIGTLADHSHGSPECQPGSKEVVCFDGRSTAAGVSLGWRGARSAQAWPVSVSASAWWRDERGSLQSVNGQGDFRARHLGGWGEVRWDLAPRWQLGARLERVGARQRLQGPGALLLAADAGLDAYRPVERQTLLLAWSPKAWTTLGLELGRERGPAAAGAAQARGRFVLLRLQLRLDGGWMLGYPEPR